MATNGSVPMTGTHLADPVHAGSAPAVALQACIDACLACAQDCTACADACLLEQSPTSLARCIRLSLDCADVCEATARVLTRRTLPDDFAMRTLVLACAAVTAAAALECLEHAPEHEHCRRCAESCRACERACLTLAKERVE
jgi:hypothetical protein